jgi:hypothetical protein
MDEQARMKILEMIDNGTITAAEGLRLLKAMEASEQDEEEEAVPLPDEPSPMPVLNHEGHEGEEEHAPKQEEAAPVAEELILIEEELIPIEQEASPSSEPIYVRAVEAAPAESVATASIPLPEEPVLEQEEVAPLKEEPIPQPQAVSVPPPEQAESATAENRVPPEGASAQESTKPKTPAFPEDVEKWRQWWMIPMWVGVGVTVVAALLMAWTINAHPENPYTFWFFCLWLPLLLGAGLIALSYASRKSRWLHLRIDQKPGERPQHIAISMPLPLRLVSWFLRTFEQRIPDLRDKHIGEMLDAVATNTSPENPLYVEVDDKEDGEKVRIYIG